MMDDLPAGQQEEVPAAGDVSRVMAGLPAGAAAGGAGPQAGGRGGDGQVAAGGRSAISYAALVSLAGCLVLLQQLQCADSG